MREPHSSGGLGGIFWLGGALAILALGAACWIAYSFLSSREYAQVTGLEIHRDALDNETVTVSYFPLVSGTVAIRRMGNDTRAADEMFDEVRPGDVGGERKVRWQLGNLKAGDVIEVDYRDGWSLATAHKVVPDLVALAADEAVGVQSTGLYSRRTQAGRQQWIGKYGGTAESEKAVADALDWLARHQAQDGSWSNRCLGQGPQSRCDKDSPCTGPGGTFEMAHSGLAILAFQAGGHYYCNGDTYSDVVRRGLDYIVDRQREDGALVGSLSVGRRGKYHNYYMYEHGIATFALGDACAAAAELQEIANPRYLHCLAKAVEFIERNQHDDGGWRYTDNLSAPSDTSVSGWQVLALKSAREAGVPVSDECIAKIRKFFQSRETGENGRTAYTHGRQVQTEATTGVGMLAKQFILDEPDAPLVKDAARYLAGYAHRSWSSDAPAVKRPDYYLWYNCTLGMFQAGGDVWTKWNDCVRDTIIALQRHQGCERGSWSPTDGWGERGGRIYSTALAALTLEVYYRYALDKENHRDAFDLKVTTRPTPGDEGTAALTLSHTDDDATKLGGKSKKSFHKLAKSVLDSAAPDH